MKTITAKEISTNLPMTVNSMMTDLAFKDKQIKFTELKTGKAFMLKGEVQDPHKMKVLVSDETQIFGVIE